MIWARHIEFERQLFLQVCKFELLAVRTNWFLHCTFSEIEIYRVCLWWRRDRCVHRATSLQRCDDEMKWNRTGDEQQQQQQQHNLYRNTKMGSSAVVRVNIVPCHWPLVAIIYHITECKYTAPASLSLSLCNVCYSATSASGALMLLFENLDYVWCDMIAIAILGCFQMAYMTTASSAMTWWRTCTRNGDLQYIIIW